MVLKAQIGGYDIGRVFMDAGSGINLIYARTLRAMCISLDSLKPMDYSFHGIVLGSANYPLRKIELDVCFGNSSNNRKEKLEFKVIDWSSQYHAILGCPAFAKSMAVPHYVYLMRHGVDGFSPSSWEPQEEGMMSTAANFPLVRNQGLIVSRKKPNVRR
jgi:hypothetical protein